MSTQSSFTLLEIKELLPKYSTQQSFYKKAYVLRDDSNNVALKSYTTIVAEIINGEVKISGEYSRTTMIHIREFLKQYDSSFDTSLKNIRAIIANN
jgi:hypothetical protein